jgi:hypothetical protein
MLILYVCGTAKLHDLSPTEGQYLDLARGYIQAIELS